MAAVEQSIKALQERFDSQRVELLDLKQHVERRPLVQPAISPQAQNNWLLVVVILALVAILGVLVVQRPAQAAESSMAVSSTMSATPSVVESSEMAEPATDGQDPFSPYLPLISGLVGALLGSATSVITIVIQGRHEDRRHQREFAVKLALDDRNARMEHASKQGSGEVAPIAVYLNYYLEVQKALATDSLTVARLRELSEQTAELASIHRIDETRGTGSS